MEHVKMSFDQYLQYLAEHGITPEEYDAMEEQEYQILLFDYGRWLGLCL